MYSFLHLRGLKNPNPIMNVNGALKQISDQFRGYVFCSDCEDLLNKNGEKWVQNNIPHSHDAVFPLLGAIGKLTPIHIEKDLRVFDVSTEKAFDMKQLVYFGMSIFWRGAVHQWMSSSKQRAPLVSLGAYDVPIRKFLLGAGRFPKDVVLLLYIWSVGSLMMPGLFAPRPEESPECPRYWFCVPGLIFRLLIGDNVSQEARALNATHGIVSLDNRVTFGVWGYAAKRVASLPSGPKIADMLNEVATVLSEASSKE